MGRFNFVVSLFLALFFYISDASASRCIVIDKAKKDLVMLVDGKKRQEFKVSVGLDTYSDKRRIFDCSTPEGAYKVTYKKGSNEFNKFIGFSYPNIADAWYARHKGVISDQEYDKCLNAYRKGRLLPSDTELGNSLGIHGGGVSRYLDGTSACDWTKGCVALDDNDIEKLYSVASKGDDIVIFHSEKNIFQLLIPFAILEEKDYERCPGQADCSAIVRLRTEHGVVEIRLNEGLDFTRQIEIAVLNNGQQDRPALKIVDEDANGLVDEWDNVSIFDGSDGLREIQDKQEAQAQYDTVKKSVLNALATCNINMSQ